MKTVDVTFQNLDSSEISLTDVSHYFDSDPTKVRAAGCWVGTGCWVPGLCWLAGCWLASAPAALLVWRGHECCCGSHAPAPALPRPRPPQLVAGLRGDGKSPAAYIADTTTANAQVGAAGLGLGCLLRLPLRPRIPALPPTQPLTTLRPPAHCLQVRSLGETVRLDARTKLLNPKWCAAVPRAGLCVQGAGAWET